MVKMVKGLGKFVLGGGLLGKVASSLFKTPKVGDPMAAPTRDDAAAELAAEDELRRRRGGAADIITGARGAEAVPTAGRLVRGN